MSPVVSVSMPAYNAERYLPEAIESLLGQTFGDFELLAIDDGSTDSTWDILQRYARQDSRIVLWQHENMGIYHTRNEALHRARGEFVAVMDADDIAMPERLERQTEYLRAHPECAAVGGRVLMIDPDGEPLCEWFFCETHEEIEAAHLEGRSGAIANPVCTMRRAAALAVGGYREEFEVSEDYDLLLRLAEAGGRLANLPVVLCRYRQHLRSVSHLKNQRQKVAARTALQEALRRRGLPPLSNDGLAEAACDIDELGIHRKWAWWALGAGNVATARKHAFSALRGSPLSLDSWRVLACALRGH